MFWAANKIFSISGLRVQTGIIIDEFKYILPFNSLWEYFLRNYFRRNTFRRKSFDKIFHRKKNEKLFWTEMFGQIFPTEIFDNTFQMEIFRQHIYDENI